MNWSRVKLVLAVAAAVMAAATLNAGQAFATTAPTLVPTLDCVVDSGGGLYTAYFGYINSGAFTITPRTDQVLRTLVFLTTDSANVDTTADVVTLHTGARRAAQR